MTISQNLSMPINFGQLLELKEVALSTGQWFAHFHDAELLFVNQSRKQTLKVKPHGEGIFGVSAIWCKETLTDFDSIVEFTKKEGN